MIYPLLRRLIIWTWYDVSARMARVSCGSAKVRIKEAFIFAKVTSRDVRDGVLLWVGVEETAGEASGLRVFS